MARALKFNFLNSSFLSFSAESLGLIEQKAIPTFHLQIQATLTQK